MLSLCILPEQPARGTLHPVERWLGKCWPADREWVFHIFNYRTESKQKMEKQCVYIICAGKIKRKQLKKWEIGERKRKSNKPQTVV